MKVFKKCSCCTIPWFTRNEFLQDKNIELVGYQANFTHLELGYLLFNHLLCKSTIAIHAGIFSDLYDGPVFGERMTGTGPCPGYCFQEEFLQPCQAPCECSYVREIMQMIRDWPKEEFPLSRAVLGQYI